MYNYHYVNKAQRAFAHNGKYVIQVLYDSIESFATQVTPDKLSIPWDCAIIYVLRKA
jgi:hypothetical protein